MNKMSVEPLIRTENLKKYYKTPNGMLHAVDDINFNIYKGSTLGVVGESGCGKSTLGRLILGLTKATAGKVFFEGRDITNLSFKEAKKIRTDLQIIFQDPFSSLNPRKTVGEIIADPIKINKILTDRKQINEMVFETMDIVGLDERYINTYPHELDGGRRQRIGIARALVMKPKFIVCDEPVSALDVSIQAQILNLMMDLQESMGLTYLFITHDLSVVRHISDEIAVMYLGQCVEKAKAEELFNNPCHPYTKALLSAIPKPELRKDRRKNLIKGEVTSPINPPIGCRFASRCELCDDQCKNKPIELREITDGHYVACANI